MYGIPYTQPCTRPHTKCRTRYQRERDQRRRETRRVKHTHAHTAKRSKTTHTHSPHINKLHRSAHTYIYATARDASVRGGNTNKHARMTQYAICAKYNQRPPPVASVRLTRERIDGGHVGQLVSAAAAAAAVSTGRRRRMLQQLDARWSLVHFTLRR